MRKEKRDRRFRLPLRLLIGLLAAMLLLTGGMLAFICIQEGTVLKNPDSLHGYDAIIVLGAQVRADGQLSVQLSWRLDAAVHAYEQKPVPIVVCGAKGKDEPEPEADAMSRYLQEKGIPSTMILKDPESFNTKENIANAKTLLKTIPGIETVLIVTSDYHVPRAVAIARDEGLSAEGLGSPCRPEYWLKNHGRETLAWIKYLIGKYLHIHI